MFQFNPRFPMPMVGKIEERQPLIFGVVRCVEQPPPEHDRHEHPKHQKEHLERPVAFAAQPDAKE